MYSAFTPPDVGGGVVSWRGLLKKEDEEHFNTFFVSSSPRRRPPTRSQTLYTDRFVAISKNNVGLPGHENPLFAYVTFCAVISNFNVESAVLFESKKH